MYVMPWIYRTDIFSLDGITGSQRQYIHWLLETCTEGKVDIQSIIIEEAIDLLATKLRTPLQIQRHLSLSMEVGYLMGKKPISAELVESVLSRQLDDLEPTLASHGYRTKDLVEQFDARTSEIKASRSVTCSIQREPPSCGTRCWHQGCRCRFSRN